ncbi:MULTISPECIES: hypothetical protein [unclassified Aeromonas]|uniref:hypothetical protein n=1 Tax=unclassified Aeromonas TaxID=257493 RepID=UPI0022E5867A|nr:MULTISPECIES: hypothetical protein [unclassified Aeromonas]
METNKVLDINSETASKYIPIFEDVFSDKFSSRKDEQRRIWYFESSTLSFALGSTFTMGKSLEYIKSELIQGLENGLYKKDEINTL